MKKYFKYTVGALLLLNSLSCQENTRVPSTQLLKEMDLKRGALISCGAIENEFGSLVFEIPGSVAVKESFTLGLKLLHSFEYDEAEKVFAGIIDREPGSAMAYWGVAMSNFHPLWSPPSEPEIVKGAKAIAIARTIEPKTEKESGYIEAVAAFYENWQNNSHLKRCIAFELAMEKLYAKYPADKEAAIFYALSLTAAADPADKTFSNQKKAGEILNSLYPNQPNHPGIVHYLIHTYDSPELAELGLPAARKYASVAPSSAHALHMPSHIFTRLGLWDECIRSNLSSVSAAQCYAKQAGMNGHWDEELHGLDYLMYAYLQKGDDQHAMEQLAYLKAIKQVETVDFKVAYAVAAIPSRYVLENKMWAEAAGLQVHQEHFLPENQPWPKALIYFSRLMGAVHTGEITAANEALDMLKNMHTQLLQHKDAYKAGKVAISVKSGEAWIALKKGNRDGAIRLMRQAAEWEDLTEKSPVSPGEVIPATELLGDMYLQLGDNHKALEAYEADLKKQPNRFNGLYGAGLSAERSGYKQKAASYYKRLIAIAVTNSARPELKTAKAYLNAN